MLKGKTVLVTGATAGLGLVIAEEFGKQGCNVVLNGLASAADMAPHLKRIEKSGAGGAIFHGADLARRAEIADLFAVTEKRFGGVEILVNNAVVRHIGLVEDIADDDWENDVAVNLSACFYTIKHVLPGMKKRGWGRIINISSILGIRAQAQRVGYATAKAGLIGMTRVVALETAEQDITCNAICPGTILTPFHEKTLSDAAKKEGLTLDAVTKRYLSTRNPSRKFIDPEGIAGLCLFLCSPAGRDITAAVLPIDGGWTAM